MREFLEKDLVYDVLAFNQRENLYDYEQPTAVRQLMGVLRLLNEESRKI